MKSAPRAGAAETMSETLSESNSMHRNRNFGAVICVSEGCGTKIWPADQEAGFHHLNKCP